MTGKPDQPTPEGATPLTAVVKRLQGAIDNRCGLWLSQEDAGFLESHLHATSQAPAGGSPLRALIAKWRVIADRFRSGAGPIDYGPCRDAMLRVQSEIWAKAADELEQALAAQPPSEAQWCETCRSSHPLNESHVGEIAKTETPPSEALHRCSGCGHRWDGELKGAELCGDCWRRAQPILHDKAETLSARLAEWFKKAALIAEAQNLIADCWSVGFECPEFRPGPALPGFTSDHCVCGDMKWVHDAARLLRALTDALRGKI